MNQKIQYHRRFVILLICLLAACEQNSGSLRVEDAWARASAPESESAAVYLSLVNDTNEPQIIRKFSTDIATAIHLHETRVIDGVSRMQMLEELVLEAGESIKLAPGGMHIMLMGLQKPLKQGEVFRLQIETEREIREVTVTVVSINQISGP
ncbi:MAG: copper chaperone PCu(A)C [Gammaproteobacteria bacterium]|nr:copper chaperone PCu(A)C [Gammaproteobacteria bacterium]